MTVPAIRAEENYIAETNISDDNMTVMYLVKAGYGTMAEIRNLDTPEFLDLVEYEQIGNAIHRHLSKGK